MTKRKFFSKFFLNKRSRESRSRNKGWWSLERSIRVRREIILSLLSKHDRWTPITRRIPVFAHARRTPLARERILPPFPPLKPALGDFCRLLPDPLENWLSPFVFASHRWESKLPIPLAIDPDDWSFWFDNRAR